MEKQLDHLIEQMQTNGYGIWDNFITKGAVEQLKQKGEDALISGNFKDAGIGRLQQHQTNKTIRGDKVMWLTHSTINEWCPELSQNLNALTDYLNQKCFAGINQSEFHLAQYDSGAFYKKHLDQFQNNGDRRFTVIVYLNSQWKKTDGGELKIYLPSNEIIIEPVAGRLVFFESGFLEHEVLTSHVPRWSFTGWLKRVSIPQMPCSTNY